jgi:predicted MFS family arabinose efflux permease
MTDQASTLTRLTVAVTGAHLADQMLLALLPLVLTAAGASAAVVGLVVAAQAAAWLVVSLPAGALADRLSRRTLMVAGAVAVVLGVALLVVASAVGLATPLVLAAAAFLAGSGVVLEVLSVFALLPRLTEGPGIASANARLEFCRAVTALGAPIVAGSAVAMGRVDVALSVAVAGALVSLIAAARLPRDVPAPGRPTPLLLAIRDGARFVAQEPILRAIAICAIAWNFAFFALTAALAPYALRVVGVSPDVLGQAWAVYAVGLLLGAALAPWAVRRVRTGTLFMFGPGSSALAVALLAGLPEQGAWPLWVGLFGVGFGPMLWLVLQTSVRQIVTPPDMLGRVAATISTAIYGVRPIGALAAGALAEVAGSPAAIWLAAVAFVVSGAAMAMSPAARLRTMPTATAAV